MYEYVKEGKEEGQEEEEKRKWENKRCQLEKCLKL